MVGGVAFLALESALDWTFALPWWVRACGLAFGMGGVLFAGWRGGWRAWRRTPDEDAVALMIERALPAFAGRFIAAVQLGRGLREASSPALIRELLRQTSAMAAGMSFHEVVSTAGLRKWLKIAGAALLVVAGLWVAAGANSAPLLRRALLSHEPVPRKTRISSATGNRLIAVGDDLTIEASTSGLVPAEGSVHLQTTSGRKETFQLRPSDARARHFQQTLRSIQEPFEYVIALGDATTESFRVGVRSRPSILSVECQQTFPAYTQLAPRRRAVGDLKVLAGSRLVLRIAASRPVPHATARLVGADRESPVQEVAMRPETQDPSAFAGELIIPADGVSGLTFHLTDAEGIESRGGAVYRIDVVRDEPPTIAIHAPERREELLTANATMLLAFEARDDFGIGKLRLHYAVGWVEGAPHQTIELDLGGGVPKTVARRFDWKMAALQPRVGEGSVVDYWLEAIDANDATGPGSVVTEHRQARIVSDPEKRADLANRLGDAMEGLNEVRQGQEELNQRLGEIIFAKPNATP